MLTSSLQISNSCKVYLLCNFFWSLKCYNILITLLKMIITIRRWLALFPTTSVQNIIFILRSISNFCMPSPSSLLFISHLEALSIFCSWSVLNSVVCTLLTFDGWFHLFFLTVQKLWGRLSRRLCNFGELLLQRLVSNKLFRILGCWRCWPRHLEWQVHNFIVWC